MLKSSMTVSPARRSTSGARSPRQYAVTCRPTNQVSYAETRLAERMTPLTLVPLDEAPIVRTAQPSVDALRRPGASVAYPPTGLLTLLATEPEPDKLPAYLMQDLAQQLGA